MSLTAAQQKAIAAHGNVLVMAGAGTGKTSTLVQRCLACLTDSSSPASLDQLLVVTFTDAAAAEVRQRLREEFEKRASGTDAARWAEQLALFDTAFIGTLHSFCFRLIRQHFHELGLDPQVTVLDEGQARLMAHETLAAVLQGHYESRDESSADVRHLIQHHATGRDERIRALVLRLHHYAQARPDPDDWFAQQLALFASPEPRRWREWLVEGMVDWRARWQPTLAALEAAGNRKAAECREAIERLPTGFTRSQAGTVLEQIRCAGENWASGTKTLWAKPLKNFFEEAAFLGSLAGSGAPQATDPLTEDWEWARSPMTTLLRLAQEFSVRFAGAKREAGVVDFQDLEQFALRLLWDFSAGKPTPIAEQWRARLRFVLVDEYQDINAAQDRIIAALSRHGADANRFLVGDVKQSIYRFRLADPRIFREYAARWLGDEGTTIPLSDNFRSREGLLEFVNSVFALLMRGEVGGVDYDDEARLRFGAPDERAPFRVNADPAPRAELILRLKGESQSLSEFDDASPFDIAVAELEDAEKEARLVALRLAELQKSGHAIWDKQEKQFRPVAWRDMAVLLRAPSSKAESYAKEFTKVGVPLIVERGGFFQNPEVTDLLSLLQALDNPLQDLPLLAVLRSPLVGLSLDDLATIRLAGHGHFWTALNLTSDNRPVTESDGAQLLLLPSTNHVTPPAAGRVGLFLERFRRWRRLARQASLSRCLDDVLAETHYADWVRAQERGEQRYANIQKLLGLAQHFDQFLRQGLFRFLRFLEAQAEAGAVPDVAPTAEHNAVRLMSIHQSKGLEFPVVVAADLGKTFNDQDLRGEIILDEHYGICPQVKPPRHPMSGYPSLPWFLAQLRQRRELRGEELRLLYVAMTRARDTLILTGSISAKKWESHWQGPPAQGEIATQSILAAQSYADWLGLWFVKHVERTAEAREGEAPHLRWSVFDDARLIAKVAGDLNRSGETASGADAPTLDAETDRKLRAVLTWSYPFNSATQRAAKTSVTALRREAAERDEEAQPLFREGTTHLPAESGRRVRVVASRPRSKLAAADVGNAHHRFLEHVSLEQALDAVALRSEAQRMESERILSPAETAALDFNALAAFWESAVGRKIREAAPHVHRELPFTARFRPGELAAVTGGNYDQSLEGEFVIVQGVADVVVLLPKEIWLVDFKTDEFAPAELDAKVKLYQPQLKLYSQALSRIYQRRVTECWLYFLMRQEFVRVPLEDALRPG